MKRLAAAWLSAALTCAAAVWFLPARPAAAQEPVVLQYAYWGAPEAEERVIALFKERHPGIDIQMITLEGGTTGSAASLFVMAAAGVLPDMFALSGTQGTPPQFIDAGLLLDLTPYMERDGIREEDFIPNAWNYAKRDGRIWGWPRATYGISLGTAIIAYNRNMYDAAGLPYPEPGWTFADYVENARKMTLDTSGDGVIDQWGSAQMGRSWWQVFVWSNGGELLNDDMTDVRLHEPEAIAGLQWMADLIHVHRVAPIQNGQGNFERGTAAMAQVSLSSAYRGYRDLEYDWSLTVPPRGPSGDSGYSIGGSNILAVSARTRHPEAVWSFLKFLADPEVHAIEVFEWQQATPNLRSVAVSERFLYYDGPPYDLSAIVFHNPSKPTPQHRNWPRLNSLVTDIVVNQLFSGQQSAQSAITGALPALRAALRAE